MLDARPVRVIEVTAVAEYQAFDTRYKVEPVPPVPPRKERITLFLVLAKFRMSIIAASKALVSVLERLPITEAALARGAELSEPADDPLPHSAW